MQVYENVVRAGEEYWGMMMAIDGSSISISQMNGLQMINSPRTEITQSYS